MARERGGLGMGQRVLLLSAWLVSCGFVYVLGVYVGKGMRGGAAVVSPRVALPVDAPEPPEPAADAQSPLTFYDVLGAREGARVEPRLPGAAAPAAPPPADGPSQPPVAAAKVAPAPAATAAAPGETTPAAGAPQSVPAPGAPGAKPAAPASSGGERGKLSERKLEPVSSNVTTARAPAAPGEAAAGGSPATPAPGVGARPAVPAPVVADRPPVPAPHGEGAARAPAPGQAPAQQAARPAPEPARPAIATAPGGRWTVYANPTRDRLAADHERAALRAKGYPAEVVMLRRDGHAWYRVRVGRYATQKEAEEASRRLRGEGMGHAFVQAE